jgi:Fic family protein
MKTYNYDFLRNISIPAGIVSILNEISRLNQKTEIFQNQYSDIFLNLEDIAKIQSVKASNEIEGIVATDERIKAIVNEKIEPVGKSEQEIAGYKDALNYIHTNYKKIDVTIKDILEINEIMQDRNNEVQGGVFKNKNVNVIEIDEFNHAKLRFKTVDYKQVDDAMEQVELSYMSAIGESSINQLLLIPCFILDFLCIHPFVDGNGRMSRLLSVLLLYQNNCNVIKYISFENEINKHKHYYYDSLKDSSLNWHQNQNSYFPFIENFLLTLLRCYKELDKRFVLVKNKRPTKKQRVYELIKLNIVPTSKSDIVKMIPDAKIRTIELALNELVKNKKIKKIGTSNKTTKYKTI